LIIVLLFLSFFVYFVYFVVSSVTPMLVRLAWLNVALHAAGLAFAALGMRPGTALAEPDARRTYLAAAPLGWSLGWGVWMLCALALVGFAAALAHHLDRRRPLGQLAVMLAVAGAAVDLLCDVIHITVIPDLAASPSPTLFRTIDRIATGGGLIVANGLYSLATLLLTLAAHGSPGLSRWATPCGAAAGGFGLVMVAAGFADDPPLAALSTGPTIGLYCVWTLLVAYTLRPAGGAA
jgi:hypothetical protein